MPRRAAQAIGHGALAITLAAPAAISLAAPGAISFAAPTPIT
jgi:hypothetical protein